MSADDGDQSFEAVKRYEHKSWRDFVTVISDPAPQIGCIYRGQRQDWPLIPRFVRAARQRGIEDLKGAADVHLTTFRYAIRGRHAPISGSSTDSSSTWVLGQHFGLDTPLLDWTLSPFVALYFAFEEETPSPEPDGFRYVYQMTAPIAVQSTSIYKSSFMKLCNALSDIPGLRSIGQLNDRIELVQPVVDDNPRLIAQRALSITWELGKSIEEILREVEWSGIPVLYKHAIQSSEREVCLHHLDLMNINAGTLFPDIQGAARYCNYRLAND
jgi:hypothetical protein